MKDLYLVNQLLPEPYNIFLCNFNDADEVATGLLAKLGDEFIWNVSSRCFSELFPRENLVYMTPDSPNVMTDFRYDDIFILGACVDIEDPESSKGISFEKVKRFGPLKVEKGQFVSIATDRLPTTHFSINLR